MTNEPVQNKSDREILLDIWKVVCGNPLDPEEEPGLIVEVSRLKKTQERFFKAGLWLLATIGASVISACVAFTTGIVKMGR